MGENTYNYSHNPNLMKLKKIILSLLVIILIAVGGFLLYVQTHYNQSFDESHPVKELKVKSDSSIIEHGRYLVYGPAHCAHCHTALENIPELEKGVEVPMSGGFVFELPLGNVYTPNITSDKETGIGNHSDGELYRMLRHNVRKDGAACLELMPFFNMSDEDIHAVIAFLRTVPPVKNEVPKNDYTMMGKIIRTMAIKPSEPAQNPIPFVKQDSTIAYGKYLCESVANCMGCHTNRDLKTGAFIGEPYAGGFQMGPDKSTAMYTFITPNITSDPETGYLRLYDEPGFIGRMRGGRVHQTSPMPWGPYSRLSDSDLKAIYRYLKTVKPVKQKNDGPMIPPASQS